MPRDRIAAGFGGYRQSRLEERALILMALTPRTMNSFAVRKNDAAGRLFFEQRSRAGGRPEIHIQIVEGFW